MKETVQKLPKILKCSPKWRIFAKSGHINSNYINEKRINAHQCLGFELGAAGWKVLTIPLSYGYHWQRASGQSCIVTKM